MVYLIIQLNPMMYPVEKVGNKAKSLMDMQEIENIHIPNGIVLDTDEYDKFLISNCLDFELNRSISLLKLENIDIVSWDICRLFEKAAFKESVCQELSKVLDKDKLYAVRSSCNKEDLKENSFAGQYKTFLNVPFTKVVSKIIACYRSIFEKESLSYLLKNNISISDVKMAVIVQEMVPAEYSGVSFSLNPITGKDTEMVIEVSKGLGEEAVSGKNKPEQYYYDWYQDKVNLKGSLLSDDLLKECLESFKKIQMYYGYPCDIEFAIAKNKVYILQCRRITSIKYQSVEDVWTTADFKEGGVSATVCKPLMWSLYEWVFDKAMRDFIVHSYILKYEEMEKITRMFYGRGYWNISTIKRAMHKIPTFSEEDLNHEYGIDNIEGYTTLKLTPFNIPETLKILLRQNTIIKRRFAEVEERKKSFLDKYFEYLDQSKVEIQDIKEIWKNLLFKDYYNVEFYYYWQIYMNTVYQGAFKKILNKYISESEYLILLNSLEDVSHMRPFYAMWGLSRDIRSSKRIKDYWCNMDNKSIVRDLEKGIDDYLLKELEEIILEYGYHSERELDISFPNYIEEKEKVIDNVKRMINISDKESFIINRKRAREEYQILLKDLSQRLSKVKYSFVIKIIEQMRKMIWWREELKDISTRYYHLIRIYTLLLAENLKSEGVIKNIDDIWYIKLFDISDYLEDRKSVSEIREILDKNKLYYNSYRNYMSENEIGHKVENKGKNIDTAVINGVVANSGTVTGTAKVLKDISEIWKLQKGDILVTKYTDTGWTPQFGVIGGIITEYGGVLCHAATVAREYNIPAVVCCKNIDKIQDGDIITLNGESGEIFINEK